jgi:hypothetical protein
VFVLRQALIGRQSPKTLLEKNLLVTVIVIKTLPLLTQTSRDDAGASIVHLGHRSGKGTLSGFGAAITLPALGSWVNLLETDRLKLEVGRRAICIALLRYDTVSTRENAPAREGGTSRR